jgi:hypothetical protein
MGEEEEAVLQWVGSDLINVANDLTAIAAVV